MSCLHNQGALFEVGIGTPRKTSRQLGIGSSLHVGVRVLGVLPKSLSIICMEEGVKLISTDGE